MIDKYLKVRWKLRNWAWTVIPELWLMTWKQSLPLEVKRAISSKSIKPKSKILITRVSGLCYGKRCENMMTNVQRGISCDTSIVIHGMKRGAWLEEKLLIPWNSIELRTQVLITRVSDLDYHETPENMMAKSKMVTVDHMNVLVTIEMRLLRWK